MTYDETIIGNRAAVYVTFGVSLLRGRMPGDNGPLSAADYFWMPLAAGPTPKNIAKDPGDSISRVSVAGALATLTNKKSHSFRNE